jgi:large subunit ribosomal protein L18
MAKILSRSDRRRKVHLRIRSKINGTAERPRLFVFRSHKHTYAHLIDDSKAQTLATVTTEKIDGKKLEKGAGVEAAKIVGKGIAEKAKALGINGVVFDRGGVLYHGRIKAVADAAREGGLKF